MEEYTTIAIPAQGEYEEKRSRFIALIAPVDDAEQAAALISQMRSKYFDARHNVYAYILKDGTARFSDDGEPHGTAGKPVLEVLSGSGITNAVIIVTRYFGGVLLGTGGLVRAYTAAAKDAVEHCDPVVMCKCVSCTVECGYSELRVLKELIEKHGGIMTDTQFAERVTVCFDIRTEDTAGFDAALTETFSARLSAVYGEEKFSKFKKI